MLVTAPKHWIQPGSHGREKKWREMLLPKKCKWHTVQRWVLLVVYQSLEAALSCNVLISNFRSFVQNTVKVQTNYGDCDTTLGLTQQLVTIFTMCIFQAALLRVPPIERQISACKRINNIKNASHL